MDSIIDVSHIKTAFGEQVVHEDVSFRIPAGEVVALIGASGTGKSVLLREIIGLHKPQAGAVRLFDTDVWGASEEELRTLRSRFGVLFQNGALFSALTVGENIAVPLREQMDLSPSTIERIVQLRLGLVGLSPKVSQKMPSELSGGMKKRVALARALALEPSLLFLDEPTSGLDPISARAFDTLIHTLNRSLGLSILMVTHDLDSIYGIADRVIVLESGKVLVQGSVAEVTKLKHPWINEYFSSRSAI